MADVTLPQLGETVTEGTITKWLKAVGDTVAADEPLFEVSTDKVDTEVPSPTSGTLLEIKVNEGDTVPVGAVIAVVGDGAAAPAPEQAPAAPAAEAAPAPEQAPGAPAAEAAPAPGPVEAAPPAAPAPPVPSAEDVPAPAPAAAQPAPAPAQAPSPGSAPSAPADHEPPATSGDNRLLSPVVRRLVNEYGLDPSAIAGTGTGGRITREDVLDHIDRSGAQPAPVTEEPAPAPQPAAAPAPAPAPAPAAVPAATAPPAPAVTAPAPAPAVQAGARDEIVKLSKIRKLTGEHMVMSKTVTPHAFSVVEVDYANVDRTRARVKGEWKTAEGFSLTYLPFICRALVDGLAEFPHLNASVNGDELVVHHYVDLGIAVDLNYQGLLVPVIRQADTKRLRAIAREISDLASRAKSRRLGPDEIQGGTFTVSNNGSAGSVLTAAIINQPQVAIISTDAIVRKPVVVDLPDGSEGIGIHPVGNLAMSWDHRAFDGAYAANFLLAIKTILETRDWDAEL
jgi:pyruvate dehydrogenase E2 component (dihydrolipoamide acetyltransferase)